ncbi:MAG: hypothetical protein ACO1NY_07415 [Pseudorhodoplanes sp.]
MTTAKTTGKSNENRRPEQDLDRQYGRIAISALVAALPYGGETGKQASESPDRRKERAA